MGAPASQTGLAGPDGDRKPSASALSGSIPSAWTPGPWHCERHINPGDAQAPWIGRLVEQRYTALACGDDLAERFANGALIASAPDFAEACGLTLDPGENETCGPLSWLRTALDTLKEEPVYQAASGDDPDAYWSMVFEVETLLARLKSACAKARGEVA